MGFSSGCGLRTAVLSSPAGAAKDANACPCEGRSRDSPIGRPAAAGANCQPSRFSPGLRSGKQALFPLHGSVLPPQRIRPPTTRHHDHEEGGESRPAESSPALDARDLSPPSERAGTRRNLARPGGESEGNGGGSQLHAVLGRSDEGVSTDRQRDTSVRGLLVGLLKLYKRFVSPLLPPACRFEPSCSIYAMNAIAKHGVVRGARLTARRLLKCHPFHPGGWDPVP